jgi:NADPH2:quinone reductase
VKAAYVDALGDAESIRYGELPDPTASPGRVVVRVQAVAVNSVDTLLRSGRWPTEVHFPLAVGRDLVGTVVEVGPDVEGFAPGEAVWTNSAGYGGRPGATAELVAVERDRLYRLPPGADPVAFVASIHPGATAHGALVQRARLAAHERVAVVGANGAVGMCMIQVAAAHGAEVVAVIRAAEAAERLRALGAAHVVIADADDAPSAAGAVAQSGIDVFVDASGRVDVAAAARQLSPRGRIVLIAGRRRQELDLWEFYVRETQLLGFIMSAMTVAELAATAESISARPLTVSVGRIWGFDRTAEAHGLIESGNLPRMTTARSAASSCGRPLLSVGLEQQSERRAGVSRAAGVLDEVGGHLAVDDREAPLVEPDRLRQQLRAQAVGHALDWVDAKPHARPPRLARVGVGSTGGLPHRSHMPRRA